MIVMNRVGKDIRSGTSVCLYNSDVAAYLYV